jgi:hypothetical protein
VTPSHCWGSSTSVPTDSSFTARWASESGTVVELAVFLSSVAGASVICVPQLHSYLDRVHIDSPTQASPSNWHSTSTDLSASYSELIGQPTPTQTIALTTTSEVLASETVASPVTGTGTTETVPSSIALTNPPMTGTLQAQVTETSALMATTSTTLPPEPQGQAATIATASESQLADPPTEQTQTASPTRAAIEGQRESLESEEDTSHFLITLRSSAPNSTAFVPPTDP